MVAVETSGWSTADDAKSLGLLESVVGLYVLVSSVQYDYHISLRFDCYFTSLHVKEIRKVSIGRRAS